MNGLGTQLVRNFYVAFLVSIVTMVFPCYGFSARLQIDVTLSDAPTYAELYAAAAIVGVSAWEEIHIRDNVVDVNLSDSDPIGDGQFGFAVGIPNPSMSVSAGVSGESLSGFNVGANGQFAIDGNSLHLDVSSGAAFEYSLYEFNISDEEPYIYIYDLEQRSYSASSRGSAGGILSFDQPVTIETISYDLDVYFNVETFSNENHIVVEGEFYDVHYDLTESFLINDPMTYVSIRAGEHSVLSGAYGVNKFGTMVAIGDVSIVDDEFLISATTLPLVISSGEVAFEYEAATRMPGDYNDDQEQNADDIDLLAAAILANEPADPQEGEIFDPLDLTTDELINSSDKDFLIQVLLETDYGDADLDGDVDGDDYVLALVNFDTTGGWADGDFDGDGQINGNDLVIAQTFGSGFSWADFNNDTYVDGADFSAFLGAAGVEHTRAGIGGVAIGA